MKINIKDMDQDGRKAWLLETSPEDMRRIVDALYGVDTLVENITDLDTLLVPPPKRGGRDRGRRR